MIITEACKANSFNDVQKIEDRIIVIDREIPSAADMTLTELTELEKFYEGQADAINKALSESLPQGTYDRLGIKFMQRKVTLYEGRDRT